MCLIAFAYNAHPRWPLVLIGNRDEFHARPATPAEFQPDEPSVYGGRDLEKQGSWLQVSARGRLATVTNVRAGLPVDPAALSRGHLVTDFVRAAAPVRPWLAGLEPRAPDFGRFNLLLWDGDDAWVAGNHPGYAKTQVEPGVHGLSNGAFDAPWPKVRRAEAALTAWLADADPVDPQLAPLFDALRDERLAPDEQLPDTGVGLAMERMLSPPFIRADRYGTRCSSVVLVGNEAIRFAERRYGPNGIVLGDSDERLERR